MSLLAEYVDIEMLATIMCYELIIDGLQDTRMKNVVCTFKGPDSVRDVKVSTIYM